MGLTIFLVLCNIATLVLTTVTILQTSRLWKLKAVRWLILVSVIILIGALSVLGISVAQTFEEKIIFFKMRILGTLFLAPCWLYFISSVFDRWKWLHKKEAMIVVFLPCVVNFFLMLNPSTQSLLFYDLRPFRYFDISIIAFKLGPMYSYFYLWSMGLMLLSYIISGISFVKSNGQRRYQVLALNVGLGVGIAQKVIADIAHFPEGVEFVAFTFSLLFTIIAIIYTVLRHRLLSVVPLAMERIFHEMPDPIFVIDDERRVMAINEKAKSFFNLPENYLGDPIEKLLPDIPLGPGEVAVTGKDQKPQYFHLALEKIEDGKSNSPGTVIFFRDIGEQKSAELRLHEGMEFRARLLAMLAHDLSGFVEAQSLIAFTLQENLGSEHQQHFDLLESTSMASHNLINNVMEWVKKQPTQFQLISKSFELTTLIKSTISSMDSRLVLKKVEVEFFGSDRQFFVDGDPEMMASILRNILFNALRSTPSGKKIYLSVNENQNQNQIEIKIRDEGHGLDEKELERILEASKNFNLTGVSKSQGTGIGLMLVRHFISLHQGDFKMMSKPGEGTEVLVSIPL
nr:ATP-binding protein [Bacteriovorax sp. HI3]